MRPYEVLVTSARTALIEFVPNTASIHAIKAKSPPGTSLRAHYAARFGPPVRPRDTMTDHQFQCSTEISNERCVTATAVHCCPTGSGGCMQRPHTSAGLCLNALWGDEWCDVSGRRGRRSLLRRSAPSWRAWPPTASSRTCCR